MSRKKNKRNEAGEKELREEAMEGIRRRGKREEKGERR